MEDIINRIKKKLLRKYPVFGSVTAKLKFEINDSIYSNGIPTCATDGKKMYFHSEFIKNVTEDEMLFVMAHEIGHIAFNHIYRSEGKNVELWNIATDAVLNQELKADGLKILKGGIDREDAKGYNVEDYYNLLLKEYNNKNENAYTCNRNNEEPVNNQDNNEASDNQNDDEQTNSKNNETSDNQNDDEQTNSNNNETSDNQNDDEQTNSKNNEASDNQNDDEQTNSNNNENSDNQNDDEQTNSNNNETSDNQNNDEQTNSKNNETSDNQNNDDQTNSKNNETSDNQNDDEQTNSNNNETSDNQNDDDQTNSKNNETSDNQNDDEQTNSKNNEASDNQNDDEQTNSNNNETSDNQNANEQINSKNNNDFKSNSSYKDMGHDTHSLWEKEILNKNIEEENRENQNNNKQEDIVDEMEAFKENNKKRKEIIESVMNEITQNACFGESSITTKKLNVNDVGDSSFLINWRYLLREAVQFDVDWSYRNAEIEYGIVTPQLETYCQPECEILLDTSGSISRILLKNFLKECKNIFSESRVKVGCFDDEFYGWQEVVTFDDIEQLEYLGGGGTDFDIAISAFSKRVENKIIFTDGKSSMPSFPMNVIWIVFGGIKINPNGGRVIYISEESLYNLCNSFDSVKSYCKKR